MDSQAVGNVAGDLALHFSDVGQLAGVVRAPQLRAIGCIDQVGIDTHFVAMLRDASHENGANLERLANLARVILFSFEAEDCAAGHDLDVWQLRQRSDQALS